MAVINEVQLLLCCCTCAYSEVIRTPAYEELIQLAENLKE